LDGEQKEREHDKYHAESRCTVSGAPFEQKEKRYSYQYRWGETK